MPTYKCNTHRITLEISQKSPDHGETRTAHFDIGPGSEGLVPQYPCALLLASTITPGKMRLSDYLPGNVFGECDVTEVG
jgi:hypothetical protein